MEAQPREIGRYTTKEGKVPFDKWFLALRDTKLQSIIDKRLDRVSNGNLGDYSSVGEGVCELRIDYGPGYRIYFGQVGTQIVLLLCGGAKKTQDSDIVTAIKYWKDYNS
jgi:putative addiction module killer protein